MNIEWLSEMSLSDDDRAFIMEKWRAREAETERELLALREEAQKPLRIAGLVPGESCDGLPEADGFLAGLGG